MQHLRIGRDDAGFEPRQLRRLGHGDLQPTFFHGGAQQHGVARCDVLVEQGGGCWGKDVAGGGLLYICAAIEQGGGGEGGEHGRVVVRVPVVCRAPAAVEGLLAVGILHHGVPALVAGRARHIQRQRVAVGQGEGLCVPFGDRQG
ncbi:hypothetical protein D3C81_812350 [compost metagenome]